MKTHVKLWCILFVFFIWSSTAYNRSRGAFNLKLSDIPELSLEGVHRILVVAPHPDDETIGAGGLIQAALSKQIDVRVVVLTNGDGQRLAPMVVNRRYPPSALDYIRWGEYRQGEVYAAISTLGLSEDQVYFLGYPDRGLNELWMNDWSTECPWRSAYTRETHSPYMKSYNPAASYCGYDLLVDLRTILAEFLPDLIVLPHPNDDHGDHWAASNFSMFALAQLIESNPDYYPQVVGYLVHYGFFPQPRGQRLTAFLLPPVPLVEEEGYWLRLDLTLTQAQMKLEAMQRYASQIKLLGNFLPSFARKNELFASLVIKDFAFVEHDQVQIPESGELDLHINGTSRESTRRLILAGTDIVGWYVTRIGNRLLLTAETRGRLVPGFQYLILVKTPNGQTHAYHLRSSQMTSPFRSFTADIDLEEMGNPEVIAFAAQVKQKTQFDQTGWSVAILRHTLFDVLSGGEGEE